MRFQTSTARLHERGQVQLFEARLDMRRRGPKGACLGTCVGATVTLNARGMFATPHLVVVSWGAGKCSVLQSGSLTPFPFRRAWMLGTVRL